MTRPRVTKPRDDCINLDLKFIAPPKLYTRDAIALSEKHRGNMSDSV